MIKSDFVSKLKTYRESLKQAQAACDKLHSSQIQSKALQTQIESVATAWFDEFEIPLRNHFGFSDDDLRDFRDRCGSILELLGFERPSRNKLLFELNWLATNIHQRIITRVQATQALQAKYPTLDSLLDDVNDLERDYLAEAIQCTMGGMRRAAIILGWCAAISRCHSVIEQAGFNDFNKASGQMQAMNSGRYKRFNKKFEVQNLSDLRMSVFDNDLLWVLEFMNYIDGNQHERLEICFTMRNTSAHPGEAIVTIENVLSFFSDVKSAVFDNPKMKI